MTVSYFDKVKAIHQEKVDYEERVAAANGVSALRMKQAQERVRDELDRAMALMRSIKDEAAGAGMKLEDNDYFYAWRHMGFATGGTVEDQLKPSQWLGLPPCGEAEQAARKILNQRIMGEAWIQQIRRDSPRYDVSIFMQAHTVHDGNSPDPTVPWEDTARVLFALTVMTGWSKNTNMHGVHTFIGPIPIDQVAKEDVLEAIAAARLAQLDAMKGVSASKAMALGAPAPIDVYKAMDARIAEANAEFQEFLNKRKQSLAPALGTKKATKAKKGAK